MAAMKGARAAQALVTGRAYGNAVVKVQLNTRIDPRVLALAEQYHICARKGTGGIESIGDWLTDRLIEAIREKRELRKERDERFAERDDPVFPLVFPGFDYLMAGTGCDVLSGFDEG